MAESSVNDIPGAIAEPKKKGIPLVWLVPLIAILVGIGLVVKTASERGPDIAITFKTADGIEPGKTKVRYKNVEIGVVEKVELARDLESVTANIRMSKSAEHLLVEDARFWVEKPRVSGTNVEGLGTLLSGAFIGMDIGKSSRAEREFKGLDRPPLVTFTEPGRRFYLRANQLGSIDSGSQVFYRRVAVGQVVRYEMDKDGRGINIEIFVKSPYDGFINSETRFWESSGVDVELSASGLRVDTQSLNSILAGGITFATRNRKDASPVEADASFELFERREAAMTMSDTDAATMRLIFNESVRGLVVGAPVDFRGIEVGKVTSIGGFFDDKTGLIKMTADIDLLPNRLRMINVKKRATQMSFKDAMDLLVGGGLRAQLRTGNLVSGQLLVSLDYFKDAPKTKIDWSEEIPVLPTIPGSLVGLEERVNDLMASVNGLLKKFQAIPLDQLTEDVRAVMKTLDQSIQTLDKTLKGVDRQLADDSSLQMDLRDTLREVERAAAEARVWLDYQSRHPESLLMGKPKEE